MNFRRIATAAVLAWVADLAYGFFAFNVLMSDVGAANIAIQRPAAEMSLLPGMTASFIGYFVFAYMYAKGYEGSQGTSEGLRFGVLVGALIVCFSIVWEYVAIRETASRAVWMSVATLLEFSISGTIVGAVYRPARTRPRAMSAV
jgi:hypothetical protein